MTAYVSIGWYRLIYRYWKLRLGNIVILDIGKKTKQNNNKTNKLHIKHYWLKYETVTHKIEYKVGSFDLLCMNEIKLCHLQLWNQFALHTNAHASVMRKVNLTGANWLLDRGRAEKNGHNPRTTVDTFKSRYIWQNLRQNEVHLTNKQKERTQVFTASFIPPSGILNWVCQPCGMILCLVCSSENITD